MPGNRSYPSKRCSKRLIPALIDGEAHATQALALLQGPLADDFVETDAGSHRDIEA